MTVKEIVIVLLILFHWVGVAVAGGGVDGKHGEERAGKTHLHRKGEREPHSTTQQHEDPFETRALKTQDSDSHSHSALLLRRRKMDETTRSHRNGEIGQAREPCAARAG